MGNKGATLSHTIIDERLDILAVVETWHERSGSITLRRVVPAGFRCIDAARAITLDVETDSVEFQNYCGLAFIYRNNIRFQQRTFDVTVTMFEYLYGCATNPHGCFVLLAIYRLGSQAVTASFFDDLSAVLEWLATYACPVIICGDLNVHVDEPGDTNAARLHQLLELFG